MTKKLGAKNVCLIAMDQKVEDGTTVTKDQTEIIKENFLKLFETKSLKGLTMQDLEKEMKPDSLLERFAYRNKDKHDKDFMAIKGAKGQLEGKLAD